MKVLVVDDSDVMRERLVREISKQKNITVVGEAIIPEGAIELYTTEKPDVVLLDIRLRIGNGLDVLKAIKKNKNSAKVIIFTGYPYPHYEERFLKEGADYFFNKKDEFEKMLDVLKSLAAKQN